MMKAVSDVRRVGQLRRTVVPHPDPLPTPGEGIRREGNWRETVGARRKEHRMGLREYSGEAEIFRLRSG